MGWLHRAGRELLASVVDRDPPVERGAERTTPGGRALFEGLEPDRSRAVLDLGPAEGSSLGVYSRFARWVRFADVLTRALSPAGWAAALPTIPANPERPYDLLVIWDILDRLPPEGRPRLVERITEISSPDARLLAVVGVSEPRPTRLLRYSLADVDRMCYAEAEQPAPLYPPVLPAQVGRVLAPFHITRAFSTAVGIREYVAVRQG